MRPVLFEQVFAQA